MQDLELRKCKKESFRGKKESSHRNAGAACGKISTVIYVQGEAGYQNATVDYGEAGTPTILAALNPEML